MQDGEAVPSWDLPASIDLWVTIIMGSLSLSLFLQTPEKDRGRQGQQNSRVNEKRNKTRAQMTPVSSCHCL
ncbi:hypothetical protein LZ31DRAFT_553518 [Colletotrichum somersetense]|nr:hypothetical protein LZ31DRAFT_553518 [Colletotrichum somersetense]